MRKRTSAIVLIASITSLAFLFQNCSDQSFTQASVDKPITRAADIFDPDATGRINVDDDDFPGVVTETGGPNCRDELNSLTTPVRVLTVVDTSGSNAYGETTDPNRAVRSGSIQRFYNTYNTRSNFNWGFITFAASSAQSLIGSAAFPVFGSSSSMNTAINIFIGINDDGATPYLPALSLAKKAISDDTARPANSKYIVVFLSDGRPNPDVSVTTLKSEVASLISLVPGKVSFNTVYYGQYDANAANRLREMAASGGGNFLDTNANGTGTAFSISDLVTIPGTVCY